MLFRLAEAGGKFVSFAKNKFTKHSSLAEESGAKNTEEKKTGESDLKNRTILSDEKSYKLQRKKEAAFQLLQESSQERENRNKQVRSYFVENKRNKINKMPIINIMLSTPHKACTKKIKANATYFLP